MNWAAACWSVGQGEGPAAFLDYTDIRVLLGMEFKAPQGWNGHVEVGYVFDRKINFASDGPDFNLGNTLMLRAGFGFYAGQVHLISG